MNKQWRAVFAALILIGGLQHAVWAEEEADPAEVQIGERLFMETRFAHAHSAGVTSDPAVAHNVTVTGKLPGAFSGQTMNCRSCHLVDDHLKTQGGGMRSYADFARRTPIPERNDSARFTTRNSQSLVNIAIPGRPGSLFHNDGEFAAMADLVHATLTGRNYGWLPGEEKQAVAHVAAVIRQDDGKGELAKEFGGSYRKVLKGADQSLRKDLVLPADYRLDVDKASDRQIMDAVAKLISAYVLNLQYARDAQDRYSASPFDRFLETNKLPRKPMKGESDRDYSRRLLRLVNGLKTPVLVAGGKETFRFHKQAFVFGKQELQGLRVFLDEKRGNCIACHAAPHFSDYGFHNTGVSQREYDAHHGAGAFMKLEVPALAQRDAKKDLPPFGPYRQIPNKSKPGHVDLGMWNVYANPSLPKPQAQLMKLMCAERKDRKCDAAMLLPMTVGRFKTPVLRDLGHSQPYFHDGHADDLKAAVNHYVSASAQAKAGTLRNAAPALKAMNLAAGDVAALAAFLQALNEDYE